MRRHAKASPAGSTDGTGSSRGHVRRAVATRGAFGGSKGSGAPSLRLIGLLAIAITVLFAVSATSAFAVIKEVGTFAGGGPLPGGAGTADGKLQNPGQADVNDASGKIYVADTGNNRVEVFKPTTNDAEYDSKATVAAPTGLAIDQASGDVYVANAAGIAKYDEDLNPIASGWTAPTATGNLAVDPSSGDLLVADTANNLIRRFGSDGTAAGTFAAARPVDVAVNSTGEVFVVTTTGNITGGEGACGPTSSVKRFSGAGVETGTVGPALELPGAVAVDPDDDSIIVAANVGEYACERGFWPRIAFFEADGTFAQTVEVVGNDYAMVPGLAAQGGGSSRVLAGTKSPVNDQFGFTGISVIEDFVAPEVTLDPVDPADVGANEATFSGSINPNGRAISWRFEYSGNGGVSWTPTSTAVLPAGQAPVNVSATARELAAKHPYQVKLVANEVTSSPQSFTTLSAAPLVKTLGTVQAAATEVVLRGSVNPNGEATTYYFELGESTAYGRTVPSGSELSAGSGGVFTAASVAVDGLSPQTTYHYRLVAKNDTGTEIGDDRTFTIVATDSIACPNEAVRIEQNSQALPDCRAYEMATPPGKNGNDVLIVNSAIRTALDGDSLAFSSAGGFGDSPSAPQSTQYFASRGTDAWATKGISPPQEPNGSNAERGGVIYRGFTEDLRTGFLQVFPDAPSLVSGAAPGSNLYARSTYSGSSSLMSILSQGLPAPPPSFPSPEFAGSSADGSHVAFETTVNLTPDATGSLLKAYEWADGEVRLVGILPVSEGGGPAPEGSMIGFGASGAGAPYFDRAISRDGSRIFFTAPPADTYRPPPVNPTQLYLREDGASTVRVSAPAPDAPSEATQGARYWTATPDGRYVFFTSKQKLTADSTASFTQFFESPDLYRFDAQSGELIDLSVSQTGTSAGVGPTYGRSGSEGGVIGISDDGSRVYFAARNQIVDGEPNPTGNKLYRWDEGEGVTYIATALANDESIWLQGAFDNTKESRVTADGRYMFLISRAKLDPNGDNGGHKAAYLYEAASGDVTCVSCPQDGSPQTANASMGFASSLSGTLGSTGGAETKASNRYLPRFLSDNGKHAFFMTADGLLPEDTNGVEDVYQWSEGRLSLISTGKSVERSFFGDASADGSDVFIATRERISRRDTDNNLDIYAARIDGGLREPPLPLEPCAGEACLAPGQTPSAPNAVGTGNLQGAGNVQQKRQKSKPKPCAKPKKGKGKHKSKGAQKGKGARASAKTKKGKGKPKSCKRVGK